MWFIYSQDMLFYGALKSCPVCGGTLEYNGQSYNCTGSYSEWSTCTYNTREPPRLEEPIKFPDFVHESTISDVILLPFLCMLSLRFSPHLNHLISYHLVTCIAFYICSCCWNIKTPRSDQRGSWSLAINPLSGWSYLYLVDYLEPMYVSETLCCSSEFFTFCLYCQR